MSSTPVLITIDVDGDLPLLAADRANADRRKARSVGEYGLAEGIPRLLRLLGERQLAATWFIPGALLEDHRALIADISRNGHELATQGYGHEDFSTLSLDEQLESLRRGAEQLQAATHRPVAGFRVPEGEWALELPARAHALGFVWSSSLPCDDQPFMLGSSGLWEIPWRYELEDLQYLAFNLEPAFPPGHSRIASHRTVFENWAVEWQAAKRFGTLFLLRLNAEVIGTPARCQRLGRFLDELAADPQAEFLTCGALAERLAQLQLDALEHPYAHFERIREDPDARRGTLG